MITTTAAIAADFPAAAAANAGRSNRRLVSARRHRRRQPAIQIVRLYADYAGGPGRRAGASTRRTSRTRSSSAVGVGYAWNNWLRFDVTGEYRADVKCKAVGSYNTGSAERPRFDVYDGDHAAAVFLAQRLSRSRHLVVPDAVHRRGRRRRLSQTSAVSDTGLNSNGFGTSAFGYTNTDRANWSLRLGRPRRPRLHGHPQLQGRARLSLSQHGHRRRRRKSCAVRAAAAPAADRAPTITLHNIDSHDLKLGVRWMLQPEPVVPLMRRG